MTKVQIMFQKQIRVQFIVEKNNSGIVYKQVKIGAVSAFNLTSSKTLYLSIPILFYKNVYLKSKSFYEKNMRIDKWRVF